MLKHGSRLYDCTLGAAWTLGTIQDAYHDSKESSISGGGGVLKRKAQMQSASAMRKATV
jgi:hypothetical protein